MSPIFCYKTDYSLMGLWRKVKKLVCSVLPSKTVLKLVCIFVSSKINYNSTCVSSILSPSDYSCTKNSVVVIVTSRGVTNTTHSSLLRTLLRYALPTLFYTLLNGTISSMTHTILCPHGIPFIDALQSRADIPTTPK